MKGQSNRRWRTIALLAIGVSLGTMLTATPVYSHVGGSVSHLWTKHIRPKADVRYANAVPGTDKATDADQLDGRDSSEFSAVFDVSCGPGRFLRRAGSSISVCAGDATTATTATNAHSVDGLSATTFNFNAPGGSFLGPRTRLFSLGGLTFEAKCDSRDGNDGLLVYPSTDMDNSYIRSNIPGASSDEDWDMGNWAWINSDEDKAGTIVYRRGGATDVSAQVISVNIAWDTTGTGCLLVGTVIGH